MSTIALSVSHSNKLKAAEQVRHNKAIAAQKLAEQEKLKSLEGKLAAEYDKFQRDTNDTIQEISRLEAATETGINLFRYSELLANVNYKVRNYRDQYAGTVQSRFPCYTATLAAMAAYVHAADCWRSKNESYDYPSIADGFEELLQKAWRTGPEELRKARQSIKRAQGLELWRQSDYFQGYVGQVLTDKKDAQFVVDHQSQLNQRTIEDTRNCESIHEQTRFALELWSGQHEGRYPETLGELVPKYCEAVPSCPSGGELSYASTVDKGPPDVFILNCPNHPKPTPGAIGDLLKQLGLEEGSK